MSWSTRTALKKKVTGDHLPGGSDLWVSSQRPRHTGLYVASVHIIIKHQRAIWWARSHSITPPWCHRRVLVMTSPQTQTCAMVVLAGKLTDSWWFQQILKAILLPAHPGLTGSWLLVRWMCIYIVLISPSTKWWPFSHWGWIGSATPPMQPAIDVERTS